MTSSLVGSEMCIRDSLLQFPLPFVAGAAAAVEVCEGERRALTSGSLLSCLLYTSDAADDM
eukprot:4552323-Prorocentrum_lima.AAC.1